eukprot:TRINITY_DN3216_c0_g1_i18.p1 TRINITY_DN3216_c0_g1~~TRINITY_DN3216_c0_g1_i18.p1  ORF type:complete len:143 (-),score=4.43 TRINITY_DN3216_c0_g1_i18:442-870(-)
MCIRDRYNILFICPRLSTVRRRAYFFTKGFRWLRHRSLHCFPVRLFPLLASLNFWAISDQLAFFSVLTAFFRIESSFCDHGIFMFCLFCVCAHLYLHWDSFLPGTSWAISSQSLALYAAHMSYQLQSGQSSGVANFLYSPLE